MLGIVAGLVFLGIAGASYAVLDLVFSDDRQVSRRLRGLTEYERQQAGEAEPMLVPFKARILGPTFSAAGDVLRRLLPANYRASVVERLERAGHPHGMDATRYLAATTLSAVGLALFSGVIAFLLGWSPGGLVMASLSAAVAAVLGMHLWLSGKVSARQHEIVRSLPDMLDLLTISVEAGLGFDAALAKLVKANRGALPEEFGRALQEIQAGASRREALRHMAERIDVSELSAFNASIIQADIFGISVAQVLRTQSAEMRLRRRQRAEELAQKAPVKMVIPLTLCILPATIIVVGGPAAIGIVQAFS